MYTYMSNNPVLTDVPVPKLYQYLNCTSTCPSSTKWVYILVPVPVPVPVTVPEPLPIHRVPEIVQHRYMYRYRLGYNTGTVAILVLGE